MQTELGGFIKTQTSIQSSRGSSKFRSRFPERSEPCRKKKSSPQISLRFPLSLSWLLSHVCIEWDFERLRKAWPGSCELNDSQDTNIGRCSGSNQPEQSPKWSPEAFGKETKEKKQVGQTETNCKMVNLINATTCIIKLNANGLNTN